MATSTTETAENEALYALVKCVKFNNATYQDRWTETRTQPPLCKSCDVVPSHFCDEWCMKWPRGPWKKVEAENDAEKPGS